MKKNKNNFFLFEKIFIEKKYKDHPNVKKILLSIDGNPQIEYTDEAKKIIKKLPSIYHPYNRSKILFLGGIRGEILQKCPGSHGHICCNYYVINLYIGCPLNCTYCILQAYLNQPFTIINVDVKNIFNNLKTIFKNNTSKFYRIGTGELGDSLVYDPLTNFSTDFINFFAKFPDCIFEFKTKTNFVENILKIDSPGNIVIGFSVNPPCVIKNEEGFSSSLIDRLEAAKKLVKKGYKIALHFDPIINIPDFDKEYFELIDTIFNYVSYKDIAWISLGTFRYMPDLKNMIEYNYPDSHILEEEFIENADRKYRYFKPIRVVLYRKIIEWLHAKCGEGETHESRLLIYLCMESPYVWKNSLGFLQYQEKKMNLVFKNAIL